MEPQPSVPTAPPAQIPPSQPPPAYPTSQPISAAAKGEQYHQELLARCAAGQHEYTTRFGPCGIITAIFCFPIGLICLFKDSERRCTRCGIVQP
ncbi:hypothetical protein K443DRAFT_85829 [Laccaria amethystina LaAM-08-1]|uniref:Uncharacterized protein n=1 Tax=Laccaria amethystina LaAM-08-1 TaxID=1095629 RepID=A0A0C9YD40_9AGAR|nr:hypothetical protein K443DRAFT_85829 [Laccaria amethystina LaAM-08-1]